MASDYGDEAGEKMLDNFTRFGERMGERAMYARADRMQRAFQNATRAARGTVGKAAPDREISPEWAKLDMAEFREIEDYDGIKGIIEDKLEAHGVESTWFSDPASGKEYLLFRIADAQEVWRTFDELSRETDSAKEKAAEAVKAKVEAQRGEEARGDADRAPDAQPEKRRPAHAKSVWQKYDVPVLRDLRPLEERAAHARKASAALEAEKPTAREVAREARFQEVRSK